MFSVGASAATRNSAGSSSKAGFALCAALLASACTLAPTGVDKKTYACKQDSQCAKGFLCQSGICQKEGSVGPAVSMSFSDLPANLTTWTCGGPLGLVLKDAEGRVAPASDAVEVQLSAAPSGLQFFSDAACAQEIQALQWMPTESRKDFYVQATTSANFSLSAAGAPLEAAAADLAVLP